LNRFSGAEDTSSHGGDGSRVPYAPRCHAVKPLNSLNLRLKRFFL
jgi:hypothetical protein